MMLIEKRAFASWSVRIIVFCVSSHLAYSSPSVESLNEQMERLESLLGIPTVPSQSTENSPLGISKLIPSTSMVPRKMTSDLPESLVGIEKKLAELESMVGVLPADQIVYDVVDDPWDLVDDNQTLPVEELPRVEVAEGMVVRYVPSSNSFLPVNDGEFVKVTTLFVVPSASELIVSFKGQTAVRFGENSRAVFGPPANNEQVIDLRKGTVSAFLNPERESNSPRFGIRTRAGLVEATGTFYAVTEYKGQAYTAVKKGTIKKTPSVPTSSDFAAYIKKSKVAKAARPEEKNNDN
ncbi:MAG: hypothetical protein CMI19_04055 [Opitutae bacterium]|nr:hypothetical protein [Opitutae bacterium]|tara:strand:- start:12306 stop:13187 length:882 start_codon:yes stop_codon:yes gene_type:complete